MTQRRVFVAGAYLMNGGAHMAYHIGRILHDYFHLPVYATGIHRPVDSCFQYSLEFPVVSHEELEKTITHEDILISTGGLSAMMYGPRLPGKKLCYVQGVNTYQVLDSFFDRYVFTTEFVREYANRYFGVDGPIIPPFIDTSVFQGGVAWEERRDEIVVLAFKSIAKILLPLVGRKMANRCPNVQVKAFEKLSQKQMADVLGQAKYYLSLSPMEGFGLPILEAMGSGCTATGFEAFGGKDFIVHKQNALVTNYPDIDAVAENLVFAISNPDRAREIAAQGFQTSRHFSREHFDQQWQGILEDFLQA